MIKSDGFTLGSRMCGSYVCAIFNMIKLSVLYALRECNILLNCLFVEYKISESDMGHADEYKQCRHALALAAELAEKNPEDYMKAVGPHLEANFLHYADKGDWVSQSSSE